MVVKGCFLFFVVNIDLCVNVGNVSLEVLGIWSGVLLFFFVSNCL